MPAKSVTPLLSDMTKCMVSDGIGNSARISSNFGSPLPSKGPAAFCAEETSAGGVVNT